MRLLFSSLVLLFLLFAAPARAGEIKLATWNLNWLTTRAPGDPLLPPELPGRGAEDFVRLHLYAQRLAADVLALEEVDGPEAAARLLDPAEWRFFFANEHDVQRVGIAVRRRLRARQNPDLAALDRAPEARFSLRRGVDVTIEEPGGAPLRLLALHLKAGCRQGAFLEGDRECAILGEQAGIVADWITARQGEGGGFAVLGDFNRRFQGPRDAFLRRIAKRGTLLRATEGRSDPCWGGRDFIDHILLGGAARDWLVPDSLRVLVYAEREPGRKDSLSDHCPVSVRLNLP